MSSNDPNPPDSLTLYRDVSDSELDRQQPRMTTSSYHATDSVVRPRPQAEQHPPRTRNRERSIRKEKKDLGFGQE